MWYVFVLQSEDRRFISMRRKGPIYVGCTTCPSRSLGMINKGNSGLFLSKYRPWSPRALFGPFNSDQAESLAVELRTAKRAKVPDWYQDGSSHPWVANPSLLPSRF